MTHVTRTRTSGRGQADKSYFQFSASACQLLLDMCFAALAEVHSKIFPRLAGHFSASACQRQRDMCFELKDRALVPLVEFESGLKWRFHCPLLATGVFVEGLNSVSVVWKCPSQIHN